ncbi:MAG: STAS domain-containing protein [Chitinivibrionales bacterium]|nr:STAS domain-containing protein [Chitinivibrionales bacterium]MBD3356799.1 STAS domain-containing protein [Chitinivibrionales bacterium]
MGNQEQVKIEERSGFVWVTLPDAVRMDNYTAIEKAIISNLSGKDDRLVLDLSETVYLYSSGIGLMVRIHKEMSGANGVLYLVNVSRKIRDFLESMRLDKVFTIYATDVEFEISRDEIWREKNSGQKIGFVFVAQPENGVYRINISGQMDALHDLSPLDNFEPEEHVSHYVIDLRDLDIMDTYGSQAFVDFLQKIRGWGGKCLTYGAGEMVRELMSLLSIDSLMEHFSTEQEAMDGLK